MLDDDASGLTMDMITIGKGIFEHSDDRVCIVSRLRSDVLEHESECLETTSSNVELGGSIFGQNGGNASES
jgi:hypothetical protein